MTTADVNGRLLELLGVDPDARSVTVSITAGRFPQVTVKSRPGSCPHRPDVDDQEVWESFTVRELTE